MTKPIHQTVGFKVSPESGGRITLVHANVPERFHVMIRKGWTAHYWKPWRSYLTQKGRGAKPSSE